ncbi:uncharacterized protein TNCT_461331 [Trichonephila clavata]|uniref:Ig-like domain-containing protein n=1 Tax=Trichonephila clavata TaxID=2740835 RepID=A0A8X6JIU5_TRICU|nr:uncharacterized protein TNCT_461331 [Trichonephila clavata]
MYSSLSYPNNIPEAIAPICAPNQKTAYGIAKHEEANVSCAVESDPPEVAFRWSFNNTVSETVDILSYSSDGASRSVARYIPRTKLDYGALYCFAKNAVGIMKEPCIFIIIPTAEEAYVLEHFYRHCLVMFFQRGISSKGKSNVSASWTQLRDYTKDYFNYNFTV